MLVYASTLCEELEGTHQCPCPFDQQLRNKWAKHGHHFYHFSVKIGQNRKTENKYSLYNTQISWNLLYLLIRGRRCLFSS